MHGAFYSWHSSAMQLAACLRADRNSARSFRWLPWNKTTPNGHKRRKRAGLAVKIGLLTVFPRRWFDCL